MRKNLIQPFTAVRQIAAITVLLINATCIFGQTNSAINWRLLGNNKNATFYDVQKDFIKDHLEGTLEKDKKQEQDKKQCEENEEPGLEIYQRWENYMAPRVFPSGNMALPSTNYANYAAWLQQNKSKHTRTPTTVTAANWTALGPLSKPSGYDAGVGRVDFVRFDPNFPSTTMYIGAPDGGLWRTFDGGANWSTNTDFLTIIGCSDLAIDPTNTLTMYLATGNWEFDRRSIGILKSTDGGATWNTTSLTWTPIDNFKIRRLEMDPTNPLIMMVATDGGIFRTTDGWASNTQSNITGGSSPSLYDIKFKPGDHNTMYASGTIFLKSTDNGINWSPITSGLPAASSVSRMILGVTAANTDDVYALAGNTAGGYLGLYLSTNAGVTFNLQSSTPNLLQADKGGAGSGGQATHDLGLAVSPADAKTVTIGGVNQWQSTDEGKNWTIVSYWLGSDAGNTGGNGPPDYVHADIQYITYMPGSSTTMFSTCDGGISKSTNGGLNWTDISHNLSIAQQNSVAISATNAGIIVTGLQDIGTLGDNNGAWSVIGGGDGEDAFIDRTNSSNIVASNVNGDHSVSTNGGTNFTDIMGNLPAGSFFSAIRQDPGTPALVYAGGRTQLYSCSTVFITGGPYVWTALGTPSGSGVILRFAVAPSDPSIIYAVKGDAISKSTNTGSSFTNITSSLPVGSAQLTNLAVSNTNPNKVWVTFSGYSAANKVYRTLDGGATWINVSTGLPNLPINTIVYTENSGNDAVYAGADISVYYLDNNAPSGWVAYNSQLPNNAVTDLRIYYPTLKLRASTYGRGAWESALNPIALPITLVDFNGSNKNTYNECE